MQRWWIVLRYEIKALLSHPGVAAAVVLLWVVGLYSLYYGAAEVQRQRRTITSFPRVQAEADEAYLKQRFGQSEPVGRLAYYLTLPTVNEPRPEAQLALGVRDLHPYCLGIRLLGIRGQLYDSSQDNPQKAAAGNFDFAFVVVFLCPLLVIGLTYNLWSAEEEGGTLRMLQTTSASLAAILGLKLAVRVAVVLLSVNAMLLLGGLPTGADLAPWLLVINGYLAFWFAVSVVVIAMRRNSSWNATALLSVWLVLSIMAPALTNLLSGALLPVGHGFELTMQARQVMNDGWDKPKQETFHKFLAAHPQWREQCKPEFTKFTWTWYYAMQQVADDSVAEQAQQYRARLLERQRWAELVGLVCPPINAQLLLDRLAGTDLQAQLDYWSSVERAHENLQAEFYPRIFRELELSPTQYRELRRELATHKFQPQSGALPQHSCLALLGATLGLLLMAPTLFQGSRR
jgi:ABC-2 type transport system permease protein